MAKLVEKGIAPYELPNWNKDDPDSNWYLPYKKFGPERREIFLTKLEQTGRVVLSAQFAGVAAHTVSRARKESPEFDEACKTAEAMYHEMVVARLTSQALAGQVDEKYDKEGNLLSRRTSYEQQMRILMLKRADPSYNDISRQEVSVVGGAVVVPAPIDSVESWDDVVKKYTSGANVGNASLPSLDAGPKVLDEG